MNDLFEPDVPDDPTGGEPPRRRCPETAEEAVQAIASALGWGAMTCRGRNCGARIYFATHKRTGNPIPIDASCGLNHHVTCPDSGAFRKAG